MRKSRHSDRPLLAVAVLLCVVVSACSLDQWVSVDSGAYVPIRDGVASAPVAEIEAVWVDRDNDTAWFKLADGLLTATTFIPRPRAEWPDGCPTNLNSTRMEVLGIEMPRLTLGSLAVDRPILVRGCPQDPAEIVLRNDGEIGGGGGACLGATQCVRFEPGPTPPALPRSMKGYELYSWSPDRDDRWWHTLVTGTNRDKSFDEVTADGGAITPEGVVKITVQGGEALKSLLEMLPQGEHVIWSSAGSLDGAPTTIEAALDQGVEREIVRHARRQGIELTVDR